MKQRLKVRVEEHICVGSRLCQSAAPEVFQISEERTVATVLVDEVEASDAVWDAVEGCPQEALVAEDAQTGEQLFP